MNSKKKQVNVFTIIKPEIEKLKNAGSDTAFLDSRILLAHAMSLDRPIYTHENINVSENQVTNFKRLIYQRQMGKPVSRIVKKKIIGRKSLK